MYMYIQAVLMAFNFIFLASLFSLDFWAPLAQLKRETVALSEKV